MWLWVRVVSVVSVVRQLPVLCLPWTRCLCVPCHLHVAVGSCGSCSFCSPAATGPVLALPLSMWLWVPVVSVVSVVRQLPMVSPLPSLCCCGFLWVRVVSVVRQLPVLCLSCLSPCGCGFLWFLWFLWSSSQCLELPVMVLPSFLPSFRPSFGLCLVFSGTL